MRYAVLVLLLISVPVSADPVPCRDETRKIAALQDRIASLERTLEAERFDKIQTNYKFIVATLALSKSEAVVASLKVENARLKAVPVPPMLMNDTSRASPAKIIPPSSKPPQAKRTSSKRYKPKTITRKLEPNHSGGLITRFW